MIIHWGLMLNYPYAQAHNVLKFTAGKHGSMNAATSEMECRDFKAALKQIEFHETTISAAA